MKISQIYLTAASAAIACLFSAGFVIDTGAAPMPDDAIVFADDSAQTFYAPACVSNWLSHPTQKPAALRGAELRQMHELGYSPEPQCNRTGAFDASGRSLSGLILQKAGLLPAKKHWWEKRYRAENGVFQAGVV